MFIADKNSHGRAVQIWLDECLAVLEVEQLEDHQQFPRFASPDNEIQIRLDPPLWFVDGAGSVVKARKRLIRICTTLMGEAAPAQRREWTIRKKNLT